MERCFSCSRPAVYHAYHFGRSFCAQHFKRYLVRKLRRELYRLKAVSPGDSVAVRTDGSLPSLGAARLFADATRKWKLRIYGARAGRKIDKEIRTDFLQYHVHKILKGIADGDIKQPGAVDGNIIRPFLAFPGKALAVYALLEGVAFEEDRAPELGGAFRYASVALCLNFVRAYEKLQQAF